MSQLTYKSFAVIGAGGIGAPIATALLDQSVSVVILTRPTSASTKLVPQGALVEAVDFADVSAVAEILIKHKVEVVISPVAAPAGLSIQPGLGNAAKKAGVKLFVPSEFGMPTDGHTEGIFGEKNAFIEYLTSIGIPWVRIYNGFFIEGIPWLTGLGSSGTIHILGKGDTQGSWTSTSDISGFLAYVLTTLPPSELNNTIFRLQGDRKSLREITALYGKNVPVKYHTDAVSSDLPDADYISLIQGFLEKGWTSSGWDAKAKEDNEPSADSGNKLWKGHEWKTVETALNL